MKKLLLTCLCVLSIFALRAQVSEDFSDYTVGGKIAQQAQSMGRDYWTTWSSAPGSSEDGSVDQVDGDNVAHLYPDNDQVLLFGTKTNGDWNIEFDMNVPTGKVGYFNVLAHFAGGSSVWAMQVYANATNDGQNTTYTPGTGCIHGGGSAAATFSCGHNVWIHFQVNVNLNMDLGTLYVDGQLIHQWQWSTGSFGDGNLRQLDAMNIYCSAEDNMEFYADNFVFEANAVGGAPEINVTPASITVELAPGQVGSEVVTVSNTGNSIGDYNGWLTFADATGNNGTATHEFAYSSNEVSGAVGYNTAPCTVEMAAKFTSGVYANAMGTYLDAVSFYVFNSSSGSQPSSYTARVYGQGTYSVPGEILAETTITNFTVDAWNQFTLPTGILLSGQDVWVAIEYTQGPDAYLMTYDDGIAGENANWCRRNEGAWEQLKELSSGPIGNWMIKAHSTGTAVPGGWVVPEGALSGSIFGGNEEEITLNFNAAGLTQGTYNATLHIVTNDENNPSFEIPITLNTITSDCAVPTNLSATADQNNMQINLTWEGSFQGGLISWATEEPGTQSIGTNGEADFSVAHRFATTDLSPYEGTTLTKIYFGAVEEACTYSVRVWTGGGANGPASLVVDQVVDNAAMQEINEVVLNTPVTISASQELWFGIRCNTTAGFPALCDMGPAVEGKGNMMLFNGTWTTLTQLLDGADYNWYLFANLETAKGEQVILNALNDESGVVDGEFGIAETFINTKGTMATRDVTFNVYQDGVKIAQGITETAYTVTGLDAGNYCYTVTTSCEAGEGLPSNQSCAELLEPCLAPVVTAEAIVEGDNGSIRLSWEAINGAQEYRVYYGTTMVSKTSNTETVISGLGIGNEYCFTVKTYCTNGLVSPASEPACAVISSTIEQENAFTVYPNPANNQINVKGENIQQIAVFNLVGQMVETTNNQVINTAAYSNGVYILRIQTNDGNVVSKRVVINH